MLSIKDKNDESKWDNTETSIISISLAFINSIFLVLKVLGVINWSWFWVMFPMIVEISVFIVIATMIILILFGLVIFFLLDRIFGN